MKLRGSAIILAGGQSRRMGCDKAELPWSGGTLLEHAVQKMSLLFDDVVVVSGMKRTIAMNARWIPDAPLAPEEEEGVGERGSQGPLAGLLTGLPHSTSPWAFVMACDMPFVEPDLVWFLWSLRKTDWQAVIPVAQDRPQPLCGCYRRTVMMSASELLEAGERSLEGLLAAVPVRWVMEQEMKSFDPTLTSFTNVNTPEEYIWAKEAVLHG